MSNNTSDNNFLNFEDSEEIEFSETTKINDLNPDDDNIELSHEDFAKLARQASGYHTNSDPNIRPAQENEIVSPNELQEEENYDPLSDE